MKLYASTACVPDNGNFLEVVKRYQDAGITRIELGSSHRYFPGTSEQSLGGDKAEFLIHNYFPPIADALVLNLASKDKRTRERSLEAAKNAVRLSARLNSPFYSVHAGFITDPADFGTTSFIFPAPESPLEAGRALSRYIETVEALAEFARGLGIAVLVENNVCTTEMVGKLLLQTAEEFADFFNRLRAENVGLLLDFGHLNVSATTLGFSREEFIASLSSRVRAFHVHDNDAMVDSHRPVREDSWVVQVLRRPEFRDLTAVVESKFANAAELKEHLTELGRWLETR